MSNTTSTTRKPFTLVEPKKGSSNPNITSKQDADRPLCITLGWMGSTPKLVSKYTDIWSNRGFYTMFSCAKVFETLSIYTLAYKAREMLDQVNEFFKQHPKCDSIVFHLFSNGGAFLYVHYLELIENNVEYKHLFSKIKGVVMDSLPTWTNHQILTGCYTLSKPLGSTLSSYFYLPATIPLWLPFYAFKFRKLMTCPKNQFVHSILYSKDDLLIPPHQVEAFLEQLKTNLKRDELIHTKCWDQSGHVNHLRSHPKEYVEKMNEFIKYVKLEENRKSTLSAKL
ncbi:hypothetical protein CYY_003455 [Polysphondylium violaceum]|uniref:Transmembrane protein n=1 Tax=Polysphondylium violaceum TaxID=133409 RepID=A0A8J4PZ81_9MYCE|nr:hypothetical protein CYY_003455 [Polysphondylium violaceum]